MQRFLLSLLILGMVSGLIWVAFFWQPGVGVSDPHKRLGVEAAPTGGDFVLSSYRGPVALEAFRGKVVVLNFGYTSCPDICPTSLGYLALALNQLAAAEQGQVQSLFVSVDPQRDSLQKLKQYGEYFHANILGITGTPEEVATVAALYGVAYHQVKVDSAMDYVVDHSAYTYVLDRQGKRYKTLDHGTPPETVVQVIREALSN